MTFEDAYRTHRAGVAGYARRWCWGSHTIEPDDVVQETFLAAMTQWSTRTTDNVFGWLLGIGRRVYFHLYRDGRRVKRGGRVTEIQWNAEVDQRAIPATQEMTIWIDQLRAKFAGLGPAQAVALTGMADGKSITDIADETGKSPANVRMALSLGRKRLREMVDAD